jgi:hypothetical protein
MTTYISLGINCLPREYIYKKYNLTKKNGYKSCPFDLCQTPITSLINCIETDFNFFFTDLKFIPGINADGDRSKAGPGLLNITNSYGMVFNHEGSTHSHLFLTGKNDDEFYIKNNYSEFKKRYCNRINNFYYYLKTYKNIIFIINTSDKIKLSELLILLEKKYYNNNIKIININKY